MVYVTGDTHGDFSRLSPDIFTEQKDMGRDDYLIICGDFGGVWSGGGNDDLTLDELEQLPFTILFVSGNHENFEALAGYPVSEWHGGRVQHIRSNVLHLLRGQYFDIDGHSFFTMGGARSHDISDGILEPDEPDFERKYWLYRRTRSLFRVNHISWWKEELPSEEEYAEARRNLDAHSWKMDYIITHCASDTITDIIGRGFYEHDHLTKFLEELYERADYRYWYFGHYHENLKIGRRHILLYNMIVPLEDSDEKAGESIS